MTEQQSIPEIPAAPQFTLLTDLEIQTIRRRIVDANGDLEQAGISLEEMRNVLYTARMKANPLQDNEEPSKPKRAKRESVSSTKEKLSGDAVGDFLG